MKNISLAILFLLAPLSAMANGPSTDCSEWDRTRYAHCTHFVDPAGIDPYKQGYMMQMFYDLPNGTKTPVYEICLNSNSQFEFYSKNEAGKYTQHFAIAHRGADSNLVYHDLISQTFTLIKEPMSGGVYAAPDTLTVHIPQTAPVTCNGSGPDQIKKIQIDLMKLNIEE